MTKYAVMVTESKSIRYHLERALYLATHGRQGPCWIDIPLNIQSSLINPEQLDAYDPKEDESQLPAEIKAETVKEVLKLIKSSKRPVIFAGSGIRLSGAYDKFIELVDKLNIPVVTPWNSHDNIWNEHPMFAGRPGNMGERVGNFVVQNSDLVLSIGCRLSIRQVSYNWESFAREAYKIMVDIDPYELKKPTLSIDMPIHADAADFINKMLLEIGDTKIEVKDEWINWCNEKKKKYPICLPEYWEKKSPVNPYCFINILFKALPENQVIVTGNGTACVVTFQAAFLKKGQRLFHNSGCASMGYGVPAAIGACIAQGNKKTICLDGDGSFQMNLQELQTIVHNKLPIVIFLFNNSGYHSIRQTQINYFGQPLVGVGPDSGLSFPDVSKIAYAYGIEYARIENNDQLKSIIEKAISYEDGPFLCEVMMDIEQNFTPKLSSRKLPDGKMISAPLEDMYPFLPRDEFFGEMIIEPIKE
jgi:acetolactate synthase-1/2/3 large subunit